MAEESADFGKTRLRFIVVTGDLATSGLEEELALWKETLAKLSIPYYVLPTYSHSAQE